MKLRPQRFALDLRTGRLYDRDRQKRAVKGKWFQAEIFDGGGRCKFLKRWTLFSWKGWEIYLHHWLNDDWSEHLHDHSRHMVSIGLWGSYAEELPEQRVRQWRAPWLRFFRAQHQHRVLLTSKACWTLILAWPQSHKSAFFVDGKRIAPNTYLRTAWAEAQKRC